MNDEIIEIKGELHYLWPHDGKCYRCRYFRADILRMDFGQAMKLRTGRCHSKAHNTERGHVHSSTGLDRTEDAFGCKWWFPIDMLEGEQEELFNEDIG